jgi:hypothetical protein
MPIKVTGFVNSAAAEKLLRGFEKRTGNLRPFFEGPLTNQVYQMERKIFKTEGQYIGRPWPPLLPQTIARKARIRRANMGILRRYNTLWASLTKRSAPQSVRVVTRDSLLIGTGAPYAAPHQDGTEYLRQRKMVPDAEEIPPQELRKWETLLVRHIEA